jgi:hypothetical protein
VANSKDASSLSKEAIPEKVHQATTTTGSSRSYKNNKMEDEIRNARRQNYFQRLKTVEVLQYIPPCRAPEDNPGFDVDYEGPRTHTPSHN